MPENLNMKRVAFQQTVSTMQVHKTIQELNAYDKSHIWVSF